MKKPEEYLEEIKKSDEFIKAKTDIATFLDSYASVEVKANAVKCVIGEKPSYEVDREKVVKECEKVYGWKVSATGISHYITVLKWFPNLDGKMTPSLCH